LNHNEIRRSFIDCFKAKQHVHVPSDSLVPRGDKTLLFTNAGMNQFKDIFLNLREPAHARVTNSQKCMRVSGKHNDLEDVGKDTYHHTFFEMLGNWSFGDYYKREAILFAWELLTAVWGLPKERLWATCYHDDDEARQLWLQETDVKPDQILLFAEKDNFWEMGDTGPCGPCSEIHIDLGPTFCPGRNDPTHHCGVNSGCPRFIELWNLVFIQYNKDSSGALTLLPKKHVDTGMGLERIVSVLQQTYSNYETDLFLPIIEHNQHLTGIRYGLNMDHDMSIRVIADHVRALTFLIGDNIFPSNEGRGYVLRRILRRAVRHGKKLGMDRPFLYHLVSTCIETMADAYPELKHDPDGIVNLVKREEERFYQTLQRGLQVLDTMMTRLLSEQKTVLPGQEMFMLYDTYGFPPDFTREILAEKNITIDEQGFQHAMALQKEKGRSSWAGNQHTEQHERDMKRFHDIETTIFDGYELDSEQVRIVALFRENQRVRTLETGLTGECILDRTPFYGESGGQVGDIGHLASDTGQARVITTLKSPTGHVLHVLEVTSGTVSEGAVLEARIDTDRRNNIRKNHTSTHILHAVLRETLGDHVRQAGSLVRPDYFRFDFTHFDRLDSQMLGKIQSDINRVIMQNVPVESEWTSFTHAVSEGATALFDEKYGDKVRMVRIPGVSLELCGGTHVGRTGDIGSLKLLHESGIAAGVRRIEAITGPAVLEWIDKTEANLSSVAELLKTTPENLAEKISQVLELKKDLERELAVLRQKQHSTEIGKLLEQTSLISGIKTIICRLDSMDIDGLRSIADQLKVKLERGAVVILSETAAKVTIVVTVTPDLVGSLHAGKLAGALAKIVGGGGGGRPDFAQAGGKDITKIPEALEQAPKLIAGMINPT